MIAATAFSFLPHDRPVFPTEAKHPDEVRKVLRQHQKDIARHVHWQVQPYYRESAVGYEVKSSRGITELKPSAYNVSAAEVALNDEIPPEDKGDMARYLFGGFKRCLYPVQKFHSDSERRLAVILERDALKWFKPAKGQFQIYYKHGADHPEYQPDFVPETETGIYMLEPKAKDEMEDPVVLLKKEVAEKWCERASVSAKEHGGKPWKYALIRHDLITENKTLEGLSPPLLSPAKAASSPCRK